jgi:hypothetical protein
LQASTDTKKTQHNFSTPTTMYRKQKRTNSIMVVTNTGSQGGKIGGQPRRDTTIPPQVVETVVSGSQSQMSSIGIGEFGMNPARRGNANAFCTAVKDNLFPKLKFLQGTNASLDFSMDTTSICGFLRVCCGVSEANAYQWWDDHRMMLKNIHTDCRNNKIKMLKQQFNGKFSR